MPAKRKVRRAPRKPPAVKAKRRRVARREAKPPATYFGVPQGFNVHATSAGGTRSLGSFYWGDVAGKVDNMTREDHAEATALAQALLLDVLGPSTRVSNLLQRFKWRTVLTWNRAAPWSITTDQIQEIIADIEASSKIVAEAAREAGREARPVVHEGGRGYAGVPVQWGQGLHVQSIDESFTAHPKIVTQRKPNKEN